MRKFFDKIKSKWQDNKAELLFQCLSFVLSVIFLVVGLIPTASAQVEPSSDYTIPVGIYGMNQPSTFAYDNYDIAIHFKLTYFDAYGSVIRVRTVNGVINVSYYITASNDSRITAGQYLLVQNGDVSTVPLGNYIDVQTEQPTTLGEWTRFTDMFELSTPDVPEDDNLIIRKGSYVVTHGFTIPQGPIIGYFNFTSYNRLSQKMVNYSGMRIRVSDDISYIEYYNIEEDYWEDVYVDGWMLDSFQTINVLRDAFVPEDFFNQFNTMFAPATDYDAGFTAGYDKGYWDGKLDGREEGYQQGYLQGLEDAGGDSGGFVGGIISSVFEGLDNCNIYANFSILDLLKAIVGAMGAIWLLKLLAGG